MKTKLLLSHFKFRGTHHNIPTDHPLIQEVNVSKFKNFIFSPSTPFTDSRRIINWTTQYSREKVLGRVIVSSVDNESLCAFDYNTWVGLQTMWHEGIRNPNGTVRLDLSRLSRIMDLSLGPDTSRLLQESISRLRKVPITWQFVFVDSLSKKTIRLEESLTLLKDLRFWTGEDRKIISDTSFFRINESPENLLHNKNAKPVLAILEPVVRGKTASVLYSYLDNVLKDKWFWERNIGDLLREDLKIMTVYRYPSQIKRLLERATNQIDGTPISTGSLILAIRNNKGNAGYRLVVKKEASLFPSQTGRRYRPSKS